MQSLTHLATHFGVTLSDAQLALLTRYADLIETTNKEMNLTGITEPVDVEIKHFADSLSVLQAVPAEAKSLVDVGSGAGFPGMVVAIVRPDLAVTLVESVAKKASFLQRVVEELALPNVEVANARAEEVGRHQDYRARFDVAVARAVALLPILLEYAMPLVKKGGHVIAMKSASPEELESATHAIEELGGRLSNNVSVLLPDPIVLKELYEVHPNPTGEQIDSVPPLLERKLVVIEKIADTPSEYPRRAGVPATKPL